MSAARVCECGHVRAHHVRNGCLLCKCRWFPAPSPDAERRRFTGDLDTYWSILEWMKASGDTNALANEVKFMTPVMVWPTPIGYEVARPGDWIERSADGVFRGVAGETEGGQPG